MSFLAQLSLTALGLFLFYALIWRNVGFRAERVVARGSLLYDKGDFAGALQLYRSARQRAPKSALAWECEGLACVMLEQYDDAAFSLGHAVRIEPKPVRQAHAYNVLALARDGQHGAARDAFAELATQLDALRATADASILADAARAFGSDDDVCAVMSGLLARLGELPAIHLMRGEAEWRRGRPAAAIADAVLARRADSPGASALEALARAEIGDYDGARNAALGARDALSQALRARLAGDTRAARALAPTDLEDVLQRAMTILEAGDGPGAAQILADGLAVEAEPSRIRMIRAFRAMALGQDIAEGGATAREKLALARAANRAGNGERARQLLGEASAMDPGLEEAKL